MNCRRWNKTAR